MPTVSNLKQLEKLLNQKFKQVLQQDDTNVKNVVVHEMIESIGENIYEAYSPVEYVRQMNNGGLTDRDNFEVEPTGDGVAIYSTRPATDQYGNKVTALEIIEGYASYSIEDRGRGFSNPRHAVEPARESLRRSKSLAKAFKLDLQNNGLDVK
jgi:hypothetical protein